MVKTNGAAALRLRLVVTEHQEEMGRRMRERRDDLGLSRDEVARRMGAIAAENGEVDKTNGNAIYRYEIGEVTPGAKKLDRLAKALQTHVSAFLVDEPQPGTPDLMRTLSGEGDKLTEAVEKLTQLVERQEAVETAVAALAREIAALRRQRPPGQRRAS